MGERAGRGKGARDISGDQERNDKTAIGGKKREERKGRSGTEMIIQRKRKKKRGQNIESLDPQ